MVIGCRLVIQYLYTGSNPVLTAKNQTYVSKTKIHYYRR